MAKKRNQGLWVSWWLSICKYKIYRPLKQHGEHCVDIKSFEISPLYLARKYCSNQQNLFKILGVLPQECWEFIPYALLCLINIKCHLCVKSQDSANAPTLIGRWCSWRPKSCERGWVLVMTLLENCPAGNDFQLIIFHC